VEGTRPSLCRGGRILPGGGMEVETGFETADLAVEVPVFDGDQGDEGEGELGGEAFGEFDECRIHGEESTTHLCGVKGRMEKNVRTVKIEETVKRREAEGR